MNKRGTDWYILIGLILGAVILVIVVFWVFREYITDEEMNYETCRQGIILRDMMPISSVAARSFLEASKDFATLKCKTEVITLKYDDDASVKGILSETVMKQIADQLVRCWQLYGGGKFKIFPVNFAEERYDCGICTRIHFEDELKQNIDALPLWDYLVKHDLNGNGLQRGQYNANSYASYLEIGGEMKELSLPGLTNLEEGYGSRDYVFTSKGDLFLGVSFYSNREFEFLENYRYQWSKPFYYQPGLDNLKCAIQSIPA